MARYSVSRARKFIEGFERADIFLCVDVHKKSYDVALRCEDGRTLTWGGPGDHLLEIGVRVDAVAYEVRPTGFSLCRMIEAAGLPCIVVSAWLLRTKTCLRS